jgi:dipeptidyl-peptidase-4
MIKRFFAVAFVSVISMSSFSQKKELTNEQLLKNKLPAIVNPLPSVVSWEDDNHLILRRRSHPDSSAKLFLFDPKTIKEMGLDKEPPAKAKNKNEKRISSKNDDLYLKEGENDEVRLTNDKDKEINATISPDSNFVAYTKKNNLYVIDLRSKKETRLTSDGNDSLLNGYASWVYTEEILGRASQYRAFWWSPDSKHLAFFRTDDSPVPVHIITDGGPGQQGLVEKERYPKVGEKNPEVKIGIVHLNDNHITWADFNEKDDQYFGMPYWRPDGSGLIALWINRDQNNLRMYDVNPNTGTKKEFYDEKQKTWIDLDDLNRLQFLKNGNAIMISDKTGWRHLYYYDRNGQLINPITSGRFTVTNVNWVDEKNQVVYFLARSRENTARTDFYSVRFNGKDLKRLTFGDYNHNIQMSPSGAFFITTYSNAVTPPRMALLSSDGKLLKDMGDSKGAEYNNYNFAKTEIIRVKSDDGLFDLPSLVTWPLNMDPNKRYPVLINIYGGPDAGTVMDRWNFNAFQQWYAKEGIIQIAMDHRASGHFGKEGVNYMYHNLGDWELKDYATIVKYLISKGYADPKKICITGFSYGGYMSCLALTKYADVFTHGMAGGSVTDWTFYDTHYTEKFMGTPANNAEGYKTSSVLNYTDKYKGMLQIVHGVIDDNVHIQNSLRLISQLEDQKKDFEFMLYPGGRHGWPGNKQLHFQNLKTKFVYRYLLEKPVPAELLK